MKRIFRMIFALWPFYIIALIIVGLIWTLAQKPSISEKPPMSEIPTTKAVKEEQTLEEKRMTKAIAGASTLKKAMRNPDSFKLETASLMDNGSVCYQFRSQNGFGGMNRINAVLYGVDSIKTSEMEGFSAKWNKECAGKTGEDIVDYLEMALKY